MDGAVDAATAEQAAVGGIDDGIDLERGDIGDEDGDAMWHGNFRQADEADYLGGIVSPRPCFGHSLLPEEAGSRRVCVALAARTRRLFTSPRAVRVVNRGTGAVMASAAAAIAVK